MSWTNDAAAELQALDEIAAARIGEASDGRPGRSVFRAYIELDEATGATPALLDSMLGLIAGHAPAGCAGGSVECAVRGEAALRQVAPARMLGDRAEEGLRIAGGAVHVSADWLRRTRGSR